MPHPLVKWSFEPPRAAGRPRRDRPRDPHRGAAAEGPGLRLDPDGRLGRRGRRRRRRAHAIARRVDGRAGADPDARRRARPAARGREQPGARRRSRHRRRPAAGTTPSRWPSASACRSGRSPRPAAAGSASRRATPLFRGILPPAIGPVAETLAGHDLILVAGASVFAYYPYIPGDLLPEGAELVAITSDPDEAARAPMGEAIVADVALTLAGAARRARRRRAGPPAPGARARRRSTAAEMGVEPGRRSAAPRRWPCSARVFPDDGIVVLEAPSSNARAPQPAADLAARAATTSAPAAGSASASRPRSASSSRSRTGRSSASSARARPSTRSPPSGRAVAYDVAGHVPRPPQLRVRDPQVVLARRGRRERPRTRPAGARRRRRRRRLRRPRRSGSRAATSSRRRSPRAIGSGEARASSRSASPRGCGSPEDQRSRSDRDATARAGDRADRTGSRPRHAARRSRSRRGRGRDRRARLAAELDRDRRPRARSSAGPAT